MVGCTRRHTTTTHTSTNHSQQKKLSLLHARIGAQTRQLKARRPHGYSHTPTGLDHATHTPSHPQRKQTKQKRTRTTHNNNVNTIARTSTLPRIRRLLIQHNTKRPRRSDKRIRKGPARWCARRALPCPCPCPCPTPGAACRSRGGRDGLMMTPTLRRCGWYPGPRLAAGTRRGGRGRRRSGGRDTCRGGGWCVCHHRPLSG